MSYGADPNSFQPPNMNNPYADGYGVPATAEPVYDAKIYPQQYPQGYYVPQAPQYANQYQYPTQQLPQQQVYPPQQYQQYPQNQPPVQPQNQQPQQAPTVNYVYTPPPVDSNGNYKYDMTTPSYQCITVDQWTVIENDNSQYSHLWSDPDSFTPQKFSENQKLNTKCINSGWAIAFAINFLIFIIILVCSSFIDFGPDNSTPKAMAEGETTEEYVDAIQNLLWTSMGIGIAVGVVLNIIHFAYMLCASKFYIKSGLIIGALFLLAIYCIPLAFNLTIGIITAIIGAIFFIIVMIVYCCMKKYIEFSAKVFKKTIKIQKKHPGIYLVMLLQAFLTTVVNVLFSLAIAFVIIHHWSYYIYIYLIFAYYWITVTFYYVFFLIAANLAAVTYFLEETEFFPKMPLLDSFKRSCTTTFGSASCAGFICAIIQVLRILAQSARQSDNTVIAIIGCIAFCCLQIIECLFSHISRYGLFYVTVYNIPFIEGCRRFFEVSYKKFIDVLLGKNIISSSMSVNGLVFALVGGGVGAGIGWVVLNASGYQLLSYEGILLMVLFGVFSLMFTVIIFSVVTGPTDSISYALFICFAEYPDRLKTTSYVLYEQFTYVYQTELAKKAQNAN